MLVATCKAPVNIAVIKYWGKRNEELLLPLNDSISVTLDLNQMCSTTTVCLSKKFTKDQMWLNGTEVSIDNPRVQNCLREVRRRAAEQQSSADCENAALDLSNYKMHIASVNNFPTAAGLASSAAGYACLVYTLSKVYNLKSEISDIARMGSGSACRSVYGGFVQWCKGKAEDGSDSIAKQLAAEQHWPEMRAVILVVNDQKKPVSSTIGMKNSVKTSELLHYRAQEVVEKRTSAMKKAIENKDFDTFAQITMQDSNQFHAICLDTWPPISYLSETSLNIIKIIHKFNEHHGQQLKVAYTFDAGPNAVLFTLESEIPKLINLIQHYFPSKDQNFIRGISVRTEALSLSEELLASIDLDPQPHRLKYVFYTKIGGGPVVLDSEDDHLLNEDGLPKL